MAVLSKHLSLLAPLLAFLTSNFSTLAAAQNTSTSEYDIIVVGGGAGGLVAATKFAESGLKTLLLERGGPMLYRDGNREIPAWAQEAYPDGDLTRHDAMAFYAFNYPGSVNASSYYCTNLPDNLLAACMLGGGTSVNAVQQFWPPAHYIDAAFGFEGWTSADFQPAIERVVARVPQTQYWSADKEFYNDQVYGLMGSVLKTIGLAEVNTTQSVNSKYNTFGRDVYASADGLRGGPLVGYLQDAKKLPNFTLKMYSTVESVVRNGSKITGVQVNGTVVTANSVVLSAGVWNTVALLFASGIGPEEHLQTAAAINYTSYTKDEWILNNAVGGNLHDNPQTNVAFTYNETDALPAYSLAGALTGANVSKHDADMLFYNHSGPLTNTGRQLVAWITVDDKKSSTEMTAQTICSNPTSINGTFNCQFNLNEGLLSRGRIGLGSDGNLTFADGVGPWLTNTLDVQHYAKALRKFIVGSRANPGLNVTSPTGLSSLKDYEQWLSTNAKKSNNHWGGSCTIGTTDGTKNGTGCVDINAKVYGTDNLFVIDGSLSPAPTSSNPAFLYEIIAELAVGRILKL
ncbi:hypothetical protein BP5796_09875 [Coleophoma crateriformis]|uniref:Cellobiose dehydrogenase n=1 Tax=Coleophoma crateriformis TaxID=565419 RepID=A0A3D8QTM9_9HELO|nr:hypothetical protein BP5796_09875 [Coleophoma crateriformis]